MLATETIVGDRYRLGAILGRGGGADVFHADDLTTGRPVAVKVLRSASASDLRRFEFEAETLRRLDHPAIVRMRDDGEHEGVPYLVLDLVDGESLATRLQNGPLSDGDARGMGARLAGALAYAHSLGVVHRDVKPGNVLFDEAGDAHLTDFGIARLTDMTAITSTGFVIGTAAYLAPEQVTGAGAVPASDVYALGLVILEALTGERVYPGSPSEAALARLHRAPGIPPSVAPDLAALITSMTDAEPEARPSATDVAAALGDTTMPHDATAVLPVASDATMTIPIADAAATTATTATTSTTSMTPDVPIVPWAAPTGRRRLRGPLIAAAVLALVLLLATVSNGGSGSTPPATADTTTTVPATTAPPTTVAATVPAPPKKGQDRHGKGGNGG